MIHLTLAIAVLFGATDSASLAACPAERARYVLRGTPSMTAGFVGRDPRRTPDWPATLFFYIHSGETGRTYWFLPSSGGSSGIDQMISTTDVKQRGWSPPDSDGGERPLGDFDYFQTDEAYAFLSGHPEAGESAPEHIFLPHLDDVLRHNPDEARREAVGTGFFDLETCAAG